MGSEGAERGEESNKGAAEWYGICQRCRNKGCLLDEQITRMRDGDDETEERRGGGEKKGG